MIDLIRTALWFPAAYVGLISGYLALLTVVAVLHRRRRPPVGKGLTRFAILVPAHSESLVISRLLESLGALDYPRSNFDVYVIADNCSDDTADRARSFGAHVLERIDPKHTGKGFALRWALERIRGAAHDAIVVVDADCVVSADFLRHMDGRFESGAEVIQSAYRVLNATESPLAALRLASFAGYNHLRPLARSAIGLSAGLKGTGMCFSSRVLQATDWTALTLAEDAEFHLDLVRLGVRVQFAPEATVLSDMPVTFAQSASQSARWERGRIALLRRVPGLMWDAVRKKSAVRFDAAFEQLIPPLSVPFAISIATFTAAVVCGAPTIAILAAVAFVCQLGYVFASMILVRAPLRAYLALAHVPRYVVWKIGTYLRALAPGGTTKWIRTPRHTTNR